MKNSLITSFLGIAILLTAGGSFARPAQASETTDQEQPARYWLHPKLGMVRVDPVTLVMLKSTRRSPVPQVDAKVKTAC